MIWGSKGSTNAHGCLHHLEGESLQYCTPANVMNTFQQVHFSYRNVKHDVLEQTRPGPPRF